MTNPSQGDPQVREITDLERARCDALVGADAGALDALMSDDCIVLHGSGLIERKAPFLGTVFARLDIKSIEQKDLEVRLYGTDTAVVTFVGEMLVSQKANPDAQPNLSRANFTTVWCRQAEQWRMNTMHSTRLPPA